MDLLGFRIRALLQHQAFMYRQLLNGTIPSQFRHTLKSHCQLCKLFETGLQALEQMDVILEVKIPALNELNLGLEDPIDKVISRLIWHHLQTVEIRQLHLQ